MSGGGTNVIDALNDDFFKRFHSGKRREKGYVKDVTETQNGIFVDWVSEHGEPATFHYDPSDERFKEASNGFAVGDVITTEISGAKILSARPLKLNLNEKAEITKTFRAIGEK